MVHPLLRASAVAWLACLELYLLPLRCVAAPPPMSEADQRDLQEEVWKAMAERARGGPVEEPIFTDEVVARAKAL